ncbi:Hypothetical_protein [Hexamita inflata]|uniref:Hypothetical_protein n=1 Tax=Hexamita inflata TaxID=28002 RepID=A0AA86U6P6_9EUKA|nr:Hypothetical protein HINF_LOCUS28996 [Hexamita inflata]
MQIGCTQAVQEFSCDENRSKMHLTKYQLETLLYGMETQLVPMQTQLTFEIQAATIPNLKQFGKTRKGNKDDPGDPPDDQSGRTPILKGNADIAIEYQNKHYFWDLCICQNNSTMNREYKSKLETHAKNYKVPQDQILPLVSKNLLKTHRTLQIKSVNLYQQHTQIELYLTIKKSNNIQETNKPQYNTQKTIMTTETLTTTKLWKQQYPNT